MRWVDKLRMRLQMLHRQRELQRLDAEIEFHLEELAAENVALGMTPVEARQAALRAFGNPSRLRDETGESWSWNRLEFLANDLRLAIRALARTPGFALLAILITTVGIGANLSLFTVVRSVLLKPLPFKDSERLVRLYERSSDDKFPYNNVAGGVFSEWKKQGHAFSDLAIYSDDESYNLSGSTGQLAEKVRGSQCSWNLFRFLGVEPILGRSFRAEDDQPSAPATVILSWGLWRRRFGADPSILNQTIRLEAKPYVVIGIMPSWFGFPGESVELWAPIYHEEPPAEIEALDAHDFAAVGRLHPGVSEAEARAELSVITSRLHNQHLDNAFISKAANSRPLLEDMVGEVKTPLYALLSATGCLLVIACLNVASLLVARGARRGREHAIRAALGAGRWQLFSQYLTESLVLSTAGGAAGLMMASAVVKWFVSVRAEMTRVGAIHVDSAVMLFAVGLILLCSIFAGMVSLVSIPNDQILPKLQESSRSYSAGHGQLRLRKWLLTFEVCLTVVLLIGAGLLVKSYRQLRSSNLGCVTQNVLTMHFNLPEAAYSQSLQRMSFFETLLERVRTLPGVEAAALVRVVPGEGYGGDGGFAVREHPPLAQGKSQYAIVRWADAGYFSALRIPFLKGKTFDDNQRLEKVNQVIVSQSFAREYLPGEDPIGKHLVFLGSRSFTIVGVVGDTRFRAAEPARPIMYYPLYTLLGDAVPNSATLAVRSNQDVSSLALPIQRIVQQLDRGLAISDIMTMDEIIGKSALDSSFDATLVLGFATLSLVLASTGLFGVLSYIVSKRTGEIGIRIALGARREDVFSLMLLDGLRPALVGLALGSLGGLAAARLIRSMLYATGPADPAVFLWVSAVLLVVAAAACLAPAWRAARLDPMTALRSE